MICIAVTMQALCPATAEAKKKKRRVLKPVVVKDIDVEVRNVFDPSVPGEDFWLFRVANVLHIHTRASVIRQELLMRPNTTTDLQQIEESERNLRALPFIKDATVTPLPNPDGSVNLLVKTQDSWTTQPQFDISSEGGETTFSAGFEEVNLLGFGKDLSYFYKKNEEGVTHQLGYKDPQFLNSRFRLSSEFQDTPNGNVEVVRLEKPFYSLATRSSYGVATNHTKELQKIFETGNQTSQFDHEHFDASPYYGRWINDDPLNAVRMVFSYRYGEDVYQSQPLTIPGTLPSNKALSGPLWNTTYTESDFIKETFADRAGRVEDVNLGHQAGVGLGWSDRKFGATENSLPIAANDSFGFGGDGTWFGLMSYGMTSRYALYESGQTGGRMRNTLYYGNLNYYKHAGVNFPMTTVAHAESAYLQNPDASNTLSLGGDAGLRAFKNNAFTGNKSILVNLENRFFYPQEVLHLVYIGGAVFADAGEVQTEGNGYTTKDVHMNVGAGFRFGLSRSADGTVFRVDLAYAVGPIQQGKRWIISISSSQGFRREGNTYQNAPPPTTTQ